MENLIDILELFNRKERFFLLAQALGGRQAEPKLVLSDEFRKELNSKLCINIPKDSDKKIFVGIDYHLDYIAASLVCMKEGSTTGNYNNLRTAGEKDFEIIEGSQRDVDLLVAFREGDTFHLVIIEAKAYSPWTVSQLLPKCERLREIFGNCGKRHLEVKPHFLIVGPAPTKKIIEQSHFPEWMMPKGDIRCLELKRPDVSRLEINRKDKIGKSTSYKNYSVKESK